MTHRLRPESLLFVDDICIFGCCIFLPFSSIDLVVFTHFYFSSSLVSSRRIQFSLQHLKFIEGKKSYVFINHNLIALHVKHLMCCSMNRSLLDLSMLYPMHKSKLQIYCRSVAFHKSPSTAKMKINNKRKRKYIKH